MDGDGNKAIEFDLLDKKIRRLVAKLKKYDVNLEVFEPDDITWYGRVLGKGGEGIVQECVVMYNDIPVDAAIKTMLNNSDDEVSITLDEIELLCLARDPVVTTTIQVYGVAAVPDEDDPELGQLAIITEAGIMNSLQLYQLEEIPKAVTYDLFARLAAGLYCMHNKKIIHQDLKPENILITGINRDRLGQIHKVDFKIIDLGMGKRLFSDKIITDEILGTNGYHAPEVLFEDGYDFRADIFMLGITFCVLLHDQHFLSHGNLQKWLEKVHEAKHEKLVARALYEKVVEPSLSCALELPPMIKQMIWHMLERQTRRKISLLEVVEVCREEAEKCKKTDSELPPVLTPCDNCQDSGFSCSTAGSITNRKACNHSQSISQSITANSPIRARRKPSSNVIISSPLKEENENLDSIRKTQTRVLRNKRGRSASTSQPAEEQVQRYPVKRTRRSCTTW